ncbi:MAG: OprO/OprP family phosphate-selective porin [Pirellula sp.]|jgi:hypothetical protein|nr:OprO/OprP family phosphate-selective porin [Pirellula sp.]
MTIVRLRDGRSKTLLGNCWHYPLVCLAVFWGIGDSIAWGQESEASDWAAQIQQQDERIRALEADWSRYQEQLEQELKEATKEPTKEADQGEKKEKKKSWYEKLTLRGYAQVRINKVMDLQDDSFPPQLPADASVANNQSFLIRRARLIVTGDVHEHLGVYLQPEFAARIQGAADSNDYAQIRDWYGDLYIDTTKVHRIRVGQSKIPYGWENLQSSSNRIPLDRSDSINTALRNERDLGVIYYWTPEPAQDFFKYVIDEGLKGSGNYGVFGIGFFNGQGGSFSEQNDNAHTVARFTIPGCLPNGQRYELSMQGYTGRYVVLTTPISPRGIGAAVAPSSPVEGVLDQRLAWTAVYYPQPLGFQSEWNIGRGPALNDAQDAIEERSIQGGYAQVMYQVKNHYGIWFPFFRYNYYEGGYKWERNAPWSQISDWELGTEWQIIPAAELTAMFTFADRTNTSARSQANTLSYGQFEATLARFQFQFNY